MSEWAEIPLSGAARRVLAACSIGALVCAVLIRVLGPPDTWDLMQPRAIAFTVDVVANGHWLLPEDRGEIKATKPPLYHWLAAPVVMALGYSSEIAHRFPSVLAMCLCWLIVVRWAPALVGSGDRAVGWLAGLALVANFLIFKLGYLARPDMLLTLWLVLGWFASTALFVDASSGDRRLSARARGALALGFWLCIGLGALTKGPAVLTLLAYAAVAPVLVGRRFATVHALQWWWGLPLALVVGGWWIVAVWFIDPRHVVEQLWKEEIAGRITGLGAEGSRQGPIGLLTGAPTMALYYLGRFLPWSVFSILGIAALWGRAPGGLRRWRALGRPGAALQGAAVFVIVTVGVYTLSAGKRADYIAAAFGPGSLLAAWWLLSVPPRLGVRAPWLAPACAAITFAALAAYEQLEIELDAGQRGFGDTLNDFVRQAEARIAAEPRPLALWATGATHVDSFLGYTRESNAKPMIAAARAGEPFWLIAGRANAEPTTAAEMLARWKLDVQLTEVVQTQELPPEVFPPRRLTLYLAVPARP